MTATIDQVEPLITQAQASRQTGLSLRALQHLIASGRVRCYRIAGGVRRVRLTDVQALIAECNGAAPGGE
jgi:excisionase family DNA binding protein